MIIILIAWIAAAALTLAAAVVSRRTAVAVLAAYHVGRAVERLAARGWPEGATLADELPERLRSDIANASDGG